MRITNPTITITPASPLLGGSVLVEVTYVARFTPMERLLANHGLRFQVRIRLYDVDAPEVTLTNDDFLRTQENSIITSAQIAGSPIGGLLLSSSRTYDRLDLRGPDDDNSEYWERIRARILVTPLPSNATDVVGDDELSNYVDLNTQVPTIIP